MAFPRQCDDGQQRGDREEYQNNVVQMAPPFVVDFSDDFLFSSFFYDVFFAFIKVKVLSRD
jgi:hypothetical protein